MFSVNNFIKINTLRNKDVCCFSLGRGIHEDRTSRTRLPEPGDKYVTLRNSEISRTIAPGVFKRRLC